jgi:hypothetical protein
MTQKSVQAPAHEGLCPGRCRRDDAHATERTARDATAPRHIIPICRSCGPGPPPPRSLRRQNYGNLARIWRAGTGFSSCRRGCGHQSQRERAVQGDADVMTFFTRPSSIGMCRLASRDTSSSCQLWISSPAEIPANSIAHIPSTRAPQASAVAWSRRIDRSTRPDGNP